MAKKSPQQEAKDFQGWKKKAPTCSQCRFATSSDKYDKTWRCNLGEFATKATAVCDRFDTSNDPLYKR